MPIAADANILLRFFQRTHPLHQTTRQAVRRLRSAGEVVCVLPQNIVEFWCVASRPSSARGGFGLTLEDVERQIRIVERLFFLLSDTPEVHAEWRRLVVQYGVSGMQVYDARIVACLRVHGVTRLLTFNTKDFSRYAGFVAVDPVEI